MYSTPTFANFRDSVRFARTGELTEEIISQITGVSVVALMVLDLPDDLVPESLERYQRQAHTRFLRNNRFRFDVQDDYFDPYLEEEKTWECCTPEEGMFTTSNEADVAEILSLYGPNAVQLLP